MSRGEPKRRRSSRVVDEEHGHIYIYIYILFRYVALVIRFRLMCRDVMIC